METTTPTRDRRRIWIGIAAIIVIIAGVAGTLLFINRTQEAFPPLPGGWRDNTPANTGSYASYAPSPDTPGAILAITGNRTGSRSVDGPGPGTLWRTTDGGAHWQVLTQHPAFTADAQITMPAGGNGLVLVEDLLGNMLYASHDAGITWQTLVVTDQRRSAFDAFFQAAGTYRAHHLYAATATGFLMSANDGADWTTMNQSDTNTVILSIAPDDRQNGAWWRLIQYRPAPGQASTSFAVHIQHSQDDGRTWTDSAMPPSPSLGPGYMPDMYFHGSLATRASLPGALCLALAIPYDPHQVSTTSAAVIGDIHSARVPFMPAYKLYLAQSGDGGASWHLAEIAQNQHGDGNFAPPGVQMDAAGRCTAGTSINAFLTDGPLDSALWQLAPMSQQATQLATFAHMNITMFFVQDGIPARYLVVANRSHQPIICVNDSCPVDPNSPANWPHFIWRAAT
jgi:hypothetical protein